MLALQPHLPCSLARACAAAALALQPLPCPACVVQPLSVRRTRDASRVRPPHVLRAARGASCLCCLATMLGVCAQAPRGGAGMMLNFLGLTPTSSTPTSSASGRAKPARERESSEPGPPGRVSKLANAGQEVLKQLRRAAQLRRTGKHGEANKLAEAALSIETPGARVVIFVVCHLPCYHLLRYRLPCVTFCTITFCASPSTCHLLHDHLPCYHLLRHHLLHCHLPCITFYAITFHAMRAHDQWLSC